MANQSENFVICVRNDGGADLELRKVYQVIPDVAAEREDYVRVVDESGEDYLYPSSYFVPVDLSEKSARALRSAGSPRRGTAR